MLDHAVTCFLEQRIVLVDLKLGYLLQEDSVVKV